MRSSIKVPRNRGSLIRSARREAETRSGDAMHQPPARQIQTKSHKVTGNESVLILVKGDPHSKDVEKSARRAGFSGRLIKLSFREAVRQATPLPLLITKDHESWGPCGLVSYFRKNEK
jgi:hypothetical protein